MAKFQPTPMPYVVERLDDGREIRIQWEAQGHVGDLSGALPAARLRLRDVRRGDERQARSSTPPRSARTSASSGCASSASTRSTSPSTTGTARGSTRTRPCWLSARATSAWRSGWRSRPRDIQFLRLRALPAAVPVVVRVDPAAQALDRDRRRQPGVRGAGPAGRRRLPRAGHRRGVPGRPRGGSRGRRAVPPGDLRPRGRAARRATGGHEVRRPVRVRPPGDLLLHAPAGELPDGRVPGAGACGAELRAPRGLRRVLPGVPRRPRGSCRRAHPAAARSAAVR